MREYTLKQQISLRTALACLLVCFGVTFLLYLQVQLQTKRQLALTGFELEKTMPGDLDSLLVPFLLPEQKAGIDIYLEKTKIEEQLSSIAIIYQQKDIPKNFESCWPFDHKIRSCLSSDQSQVIAIAPIQENENIYGYLVKIKKSAPWYFNNQFWNELAYTVTILLITFLLITLVISPVLNRSIPNALEQTVIWIEESMNKNPKSKLPKLRFSEFNQLAETILQVVEKHKQTQEQARISALARQVAHDIRSPLMALKLGLEEVHQLPEKSRLILQMATLRIQDIANNLVSSRDSDFKIIEPQQSQHILSQIAYILSEKRVQYKRRANLHIEMISNPAAYSLFANIDRIEFKRVLSNLINNSIEAIAGAGAIEIEVKKINNGFCEISVYDNGCGISKEVIPKLMFEGATFGKLSGNGLGLYHAKCTVESWGGEIKIESEIGIGTRVNINLPISQMPRWFPEAITIQNNSTVIVLDDDKCIHETWKVKLQQIRAETFGIKAVYFNKTTELYEWKSSHQELGQPYTYLLDYNLNGELETGLDIIQKLKIFQNSYLVTSEFENAELKARCNELAISMVPKILIDHIPLKN